MTDLKALRDDIDYVKTLANEGQAGPINGFVGFGIGMIWTLAALGVWAEMIGLFALPRPLHYGEFFIAFLVQFVFMALAFPVMRRNQATSRNAKLFGAVWGGLGFTAFIMMGGLSLMAWRGLTPSPFGPSLGVIFIALYGGAWMVCSLIAKAPWMMLVTWGCVLGVAALALLPRSGPDFMLIYAACLFLFGACPGLYMMASNAKPRG